MDGSEIRRKIEVYCTNCNRLMVPHPDNIHVCLGCASRVQVKEPPLQDKGGGIK